MDALAKLSAATYALAEAKTLDDVKRIIDIAEAARTYARAAKLGLEAANHAAEVKLRAERKAGELLQQLERDKGGRPAENSFQAGTSFSEYRAVLTDSDIAPTTAHRWQTVAQVPDEVFEEHVATVQQEQRELTSAGLLRLAGEIKQAAETIAPPPVEKPATATISVQDWNDADDAQRRAWLFMQHGGKSTFNETNDNIEWASWSWNPVTGCLHDCPYCYARDIANRFYPQKFAPSFLPDRLSAPANTKAPDLSAFSDPVLRMAKRNVFVCSMADLFGKWVPTTWIDAVLQQAWDNPQWTFLFLTKFPVRMAEFQFPQNSWIGTTVDRQYAVDRAEKAFTKIRSGGYQGVAWLSCEPMMERLTFGSLDMFDWVIMGGSSRSTQTPEHRPPFEWIVHLWAQAKALNLPVYMKTNLGIEQRVREYPEGA